jgi:hypothetical protein
VPGSVVMARSGRDACGVQELGIYCDLRFYFDAVLSGLPDLNVFKKWLNMFKS